MRILPEMCASTLCPFSSSTRNMAFGNGSVTVPSTRIMSSLGLTRASHHLNCSRLNCFCSTHSDRHLLHPAMSNHGGPERAEGAFGRPDRIPKIARDCQL